MAVLEEIITAIEQGRRRQLKMLIEEAVEEGISPEQILNEGFLPAMDNVSRKYHNEQFFVPEVILASQAMNVGTAILEEYLGGQQPPSIGRVVIGTVKGDLHNIGKNIVVMMLRGAGFEVIDLGYDVSVDAFLDTAQACEADIICMSAMLTTTMADCGLCHGHWCGYLHRGCRERGADGQGGHAEEGEAMRKREL